MANLEAGLRGIAVCGASLNWVVSFSDDPETAWNSVPRIDWILGISWMLQVDKALVVQAAVDAGRIAVALLTEPMKTARTTDFDTTEAIQNPTSKDVHNAMQLVGMCACGSGTVGVFARFRSSGDKIPAALSLQMADAVRARIPYTKVSERFIDDGQGNLTPVGLVA